MTVYFLSCVPAALRLNGTYVGVIDDFVRRVEAEEGERFFVEATPSDNKMPVNFILDDAFVSSPPPFADVYLMGGDILVRLKRFAHKDLTPSVLGQARFAGHLVTLCRMGGVKLCVDGADGDVRVYDVSDGFSSARLREGEVGGRKLLCVAAEGCLAIVSESGELAFCNPVKSYSLGNMLGVTVGYFTCAGCVGECNYSYDGKKFTPVSGRTVETRPVADGVKHFAFFESVLTHARPEAYPGEELKSRAAGLNAYLGDFAEVIVPPQKFYLRTGELTAAGLAYPQSANRYRVKFFAADMSCGLVENIREVQY